ncbi:MAG: hypothetical protein MUE74_06150 [Bacteroidales bacterium]|jgi:uncharacterized protein YkuJ|nr:hypothetical protein [Bacteroidales bacterium]
MAEFIVAEKKTEPGRKMVASPVSKGRNETRRSSFSPDILALIAEGGYDFFKYFKSLGISRERNLLVLSSKHHYYYDESDLSSVNVLVNLKKLNLIKHLDMFLSSLVRILPPDTTFIGYFSEARYGKRRYFNPEKLLRVITRFESLLDSKAESSMKRDEVSKILEKNGFSIVDMTSMNGNTYFQTRYSRRPVDWN